MENNMLYIPTSLEMSPGRKHSSSSFILSLDDNAWRDVVENKKCWSSQKKLKEDQAGTDL